MSYLTLGRKAKIAGRALKNIMLGRPLSVSFELTHNCNARCKHCDLGDYIKEPLVAPEVFADRFEELRPAVAFVSGGEPTLRKDLVRIVQQMRRRDPVPLLAMTTNAQNLTEDLYLRLCDAGLDKFSISFDYPDERHNEFRNLRKNFEHMADLIPRLALYGHKDIVLACVVQSDNFRDLPDIAEIAKQWGVAVNFSTYNSLRTGNTNYLFNSKDEIEELKQIVDRLLEMQRDGYSILSSKWTLNQMVAFFQNGQKANCRAGKRFLIVNPQGKLSPCGMFRQMYDSQKDLIREFTNNNKCDKCYTSLRVNSEKNIARLLIEVLGVIRMELATIPR